MAASLRRKHGRSWRAGSLAASCCPALSVAGECEVLGGSRARVVGDLQAAARLFRRYGHGAWAAGQDQPAVEGLIEPVPEPRHAPGGDPPQVPLVVTAGLGHRCRVLERGQLRRDQDLRPAEGVYVSGRFLLPSCLRQQEVLRDRPPTPNGARPTCDPPKRLCGCRRQARSGSTTAPSPRQSIRSPSCSTRSAVRTGGAKTHQDRSRTQPSRGLRGRAGARQSCPAAGRGESTSRRERRG
jgi:hypothetical protein